MFNATTTLEKSQKEYKQNIGNAFYLGATSEW
jgi:hypothetical protein